MPWCDSCTRFYTPSTLSSAGDCPEGHNVADPTEGLPGQVLEDAQPVEKVKAPWHFWVLVGAIVVYLGWRVIQGVALLF